jgi:neurabin
MVGETHDREDYERGNPDLDPVAESAVYELEKRLDKMSKFDLELVKDSNGYGLSIIGMGIGADSGVERLGIYVKKVFPGQAAEKVGEFLIYGREYRKISLQLFYVLK